MINLSVDPDPHRAHLITSRGCVVLEAAGGDGLDGGVWFRLVVRVPPGARRAGVGGARGDALVVRVAQPPEDGRATEACLRAVAKAFGVPRRAVRLVAGGTSRDKTVEVDGPYDALAARARELRGSGAAH